MYDLEPGQKVENFLSAFIGDIDEPERNWTSPVGNNFNQAILLNDKIAAKKLFSSFVKQPLP